ncbi:MAG: ammonium transporter [Planctomycetaceae bacterium]|nr:ammonium transporter [Planctomycetaceae bacterium]
MKNCWKLLKVGLGRTALTMPIILACLFLVGPSADAQTPTPEELSEKIGTLTVGLDTVWVMLCGMMVFFMNLGFGCVESGFARAKNTVNILSKNFVVFAVTSIFYWLIGWGIMFGGGEGADYFGKEGLWMVAGADNSPASGDAYEGAYGSISWAMVPLWAKFFFQLVFAGTAATIVSGAVAERIKYLSFIVFSALMAVVMYPVTGHWVWGGGWLATAGFWDFAGCAVVHSVGGWAAMTGAYILGPRIGKYGPDGKVQAIPGHNMTAAFIGCLVLWLGWFGFNPGSTMAVGDGTLLAKIAVNTNAAAAIATLTATATAWIVLGKPDLGMTINGCLAGLVAITAPCAWVGMIDSLIIGGVAGVFVVFSVLFFDKIKCDDPVGATSVHLGCGTLGCLAIGLFAEVPAEGAAAPAAGLFYGGGMEQLIAQIKGVLAVGVYTVVVSAICWFIIKYTIGLRVSAEEEIEGLDIGEHGHNAYHGFVMAKSEG